MRQLQVADWHTRTDEDGTVTVEGLAVPYGRSIDYAGMRESFAPGAFDVEAAHGVPLLRDHDRASLVGHVITARNSAEGLEVEAVIQPTSLGRDTATLLRSGSLRGLSVGFEPSDMEHRDTETVYTRAHLHELSLTPLPAYPDAAVAAVRSREEEAMPETDIAAVPAVPDLSDYVQRSELEALQSRMLDQQRSTEPARVLTVREAFVEQLRASHSERKLRALADVVTATNAGVLPPAWASEVVGFVDAQRYLIPRLGTMGFPATGLTLTVPKITQHTLVEAHIEKTAIPSQAMTTDSTTYDSQWYSGGVDVSLEMIWQSDPSIWALVVDDLFAQYAIATDEAASAWIPGNGTVAGATLDFTDYGTFVAQVIATAETIRAATGVAGNLLNLTTASWTSLLSLVDADGRRILSTSGATNADGSAGLTSTSVDVGGVLCFHNPRAAEDFQFNAKSARLAEKPPVSLTSDNVLLMGRDVGVIGATIPMVLYPLGVQVYSLTTRAAVTGKSEKK